MRRRNFAAGATLGALAACGGGAVSSQTCNRAVLVDCIGDSSFCGFELAQRPIKRIEATTGAQCINHAIPGWPLATHAATFDVTDSPASTVILRVGGADTLTLTPPAAFTAQLASQVAAAQGAGKRVILVGVIHTVRKPVEQNAIGIDAEAYERFAAHSQLMDNAVRAVAAMHAADFVDIRALRFDGAIDIWDAVHPAQAYSDRCADAISKTLQKL